jgi:hypothetical protein
MTSIYCHDAASYPMRASSPTPLPGTGPKSAALRRVMAGALFALGVMFAGSAFGHPALAHAAEWDIEKYDACVAPIMGEDPDDSEHQWCCYISGGVWSDSQDECVAPPENEGAPTRLTHPVAPGRVPANPVATGRAPITGVQPLPVTLAR